MIKAPFVFAIVLLLGLPAIATAGSLSWAPAGPYPTKSSCQPISFNQPDAIAVDRSGNIYIANENGSEVVQEVVSEATGPGTIRTVLSRDVEPIKSGNYFGISLAVDPQNHLYLAVKKRGTVERLNANGALTLVAGKPGDRRLVDGSSSKARLKAPDAIGISSDGVIYVADARTVRRVASDGSIVTLAGKADAKNMHPVKGGSPNYSDGGGQQAVFMSLNGIAVDSHGNVYVADTYDGEEEGQAADIGLIRKITPSGRVSTLAGTLNTMGADSDGIGSQATFGGISGIAIDRAGDLYVAESSAPSIRSISTQAAVKTILGGKYGGSANTTALVSPVGIALGVDGTLFVVDDAADWPKNNLQVNWLHRITSGKLETLCQQRRAGT